MSYQKAYKTTDEIDASTTAAITQFKEFFDIAIEENCNLDHASKILEVASVHVKKAFDQFKNNNQDLIKNNQTQTTFELFQEYVKTIFDQKMPNEEDLTLKETMQGWFFAKL